MHENIIRRRLHYAFRGRLPRPLGTSPHFYTPYSALLEKKGSEFTLCKRGFKQFRSLKPREVYILILQHGMPSPNKHYTAVANFVTVRPTLSALGVFPVRRMCKL
jgi:hypothetical protein